MRLFVYGSKDFGRVIRELVIDTGHEFAGFIDDFSEGNDVAGVWDQVAAANPPTPETGIVIAIGYEHMAARWTVFEKVRRAGYDVPALIHPTAIVHRTATVEPGAFVMAGANIDLLASIGALTVVWPGVIVSHESRVGPNCFLSPGAVLCGLVTTGDSCFVGAGAVIVDHRDVPSGTFIKAASRFA